MAWFLLRLGGEGIIAMRDLVVGDRVDQYQITEPIARGGMASLFKATDEASGLPVVLKVPHVQYESDVVFFERFRREEEIGQRIDHPGVVRVLTPREKSRMYMAMEWVEGRPLNAILYETGPLPREAALEIARQLCDALACLHAHGVVHRDLKPENVLVTSDGRVKIVDFGIALLESARRLTWAGLSHAIGTPDYMAPEQIRGKRGDARTDVYALGTMLYEMLTGRVPYEAETSTAVLRAKRTRAPVPPSSRVPGLDPAIEAIILRAIERDPRDRYACAADMLADLTHPGSAPVAERPAGSRRRASAVSRRWVSSIVVAASLAALGVLTWLSAP